MAGISPLRFREILKQRRRNLIRYKRKRPLRRVMYRYPFKEELHLQRFIKKISKRFVDRFDNWFQSHIEAWVTQRERYNFDSWDSQIDAFLRELSNDMDLFYADPKSFGIDVSREVYKLSTFVYELAKKEFGRQVFNVIGDIYFGSDAWWDEVQRNWITEFTERTKKLTYGYIDKVRDTVFKGVSENWSFEKIQEQLKIINSSFTDARVNFIARDLVGTLNGLVEQNLQQSIGLDLYVWTTMGDERVRGRPGGNYPNSIPNHWIMDGMICDWRNPLIYSMDGAKTWQTRTSDMPQEHVGIPWGCRCVGRGYFKKMTDDLDAEIKKER